MIICRLLVGMLFFLHNNSIDAVEALNKTVIYWMIYWNAYCMISLFLLTVVGHILPQRTRWCSTWLCLCVSSRYPSWQPVTGFWCRVCCRGNCPCSQCGHSGYTWYQVDWRSPGCSGHHSGISGMISSVLCPVVLLSILYFSHMFPVTIFYKQ